VGEKDITQTTKKNNHGNSGGENITYAHGEKKEDPQEKKLRRQLRWSKKLTTKRKGKLVRIG